MGEGNLWFFLKTGIFGQKRVKSQGQGQQYYYIKDLGVWKRSSTRSWGLCQIFNIFTPHIPNCISKFLNRLRRWKAVRQTTVGNFRPDLTRLYGPDLGSDPTWRFSDLVYTDTDHESCIKNLYKMARKWEN